VEVLTLQVFVSLMLVVGSVLLFAFTCRQKDFEHADRLALFPLDDDDEVKTTHPHDEPETEPRTPRHE
jgi:nitrogen fixation-related uncharacterized protein